MCVCPFVSVGGKPGPPAGARHKDAGKRERKTPTPCERTGQEKEKHKNAAGWLSWGPRALPGHGEGGPGPSPRVKSVLFFCGFSCVSAPLLHPTFLLFASGVILELQAVLGWSIRSAATHHFSAATCKLLRIREEMTARSGPLFLRNVMTDGYHCPSTRAVCCDSSDRGIEICHQI